MPKKVPKIRFKKYTDEWKEDILSEFLVVSKEKNFLEEYDKTDVLSVSGECGIVNQIEHKGRSFAGASVANYGVVDTGDIVYTKSPLLNTPYGIIKTNKGNPGIVSTLYAVYKPKENVDPNFIECYFEQNARINNYLKPLVNKGAKNDMKVTDENALKGTVTFPDKNEQKYISKFLMNLDDLITQNQKILEKYISIKKSLIQKVLPTKDHKQKLKHKEQCSILNKKAAKEIFCEISEKNYINLPVLSATQDLGMIFKEPNSIASSLNNKNYKHVSPKNFVIHLRSFQGGFAHSAYEGITSPAYTILKFIDEDSHDDYYWKYVFMSENFIKRLESVTYGIRDGRSIDYNDFLKMQFSYPDYSVQVKIGNMFKQIDKIANLYRNKIDKLTKIKNAFLEQMFV